VVCENMAGLQQLTLICRVKNWNPLKGELRYRVPGTFSIDCCHGSGGSGHGRVVMVIAGPAGCDVTSSGAQRGVCAAAAVNKVCGRWRSGARRYRLGSYRIADCIQERTVLAAIRSGTVMAPAAVLKERTEAVAFSVESASGARGWW
jgi:hypothetical protein